MQEIKTLDEAPDKGVLSKIARLEKTARALRDDYLLGFTYYYDSIAKYYFDDNRDRFTVSLSLAIDHLMRADDHELLSRVYNLIAIDAFTYGSYDAAYNFYLYAMQEAEATGSILFQSVIETNLSLLFLELRDLTKAMRHIRQAIRRLYGVRKSENVHFPLYAAYLDEAVIALEQGQDEQGRRSLQKALRFRPRHEMPGEDLRITVTMIRLRLAFADGDREEFATQADTLVTCLREEPHPAGYASDIRTLCQWLIAKREYALCNRIIDAVNDRILASDMMHVIRMFSTFKAAFYQRTGNERKLKKTLRETQVSLKEHRSNLNRIQKYIMELVRIDNNIRNARVHVRAEHERLEKKAYSDALTGIANRHMMNKLLETSFERAYKNRTLFGVCILDVDYFKQYNDTFGHPKGDTCLVAIATEMERIGKEPLPDGASVFCARYGGDEFVMIFEGIDKDGIVALAGRLEERIEALAVPNPKAGGDGIITVSQGICTGIPGSRDKVWEYLSLADDALYRVKRARGEKKRRKTRVLVCGPERRGEVKSHGTR